METSSYAERKKEGILLCKKKIEEFIKYKSNNVFYDKDENKVFMAESNWLLDLAVKMFDTLGRTGLNVGKQKVVVLDGS